MSRRSETTTKVFVGSLPADATTDDLKRLFQPYGAIAECDIANRCGFLHLEDKDLAQKAIDELNNTTFMGVRISVEKGRVKPPNRSRGRGGSGGGVGPMRGGRDRGGPYARDTFGRSRGGGFGGHDYPAYDDPYDYERSAMARFDSAYGADRRPAYDDRRAGFMADRPYPNGFDRRPYDDRAPYPDTQRSAYDDRRVTTTITGAYDDRRAQVGDRRPLMDAQVGQPPRAPLSSYDRGASTDMFSRRDGGSKSLDRSTGGYSFGSSGYSTSTTGGAYGTSSVAAGGGYGGYGDTRGTSSMGYDTRGSVQSGAYGDSRGPSGVSSYDSRAMPPLTSSMYPDSRAASSGSYSTVAPTSGYNSGSVASYNDGYGGRSGSYDAAYPPLPQQRGGMP